MVLDDALHCEHNSITCQHSSAINDPALMCTRVGPDSVPPSLPVCRAIHPQGSQVQGCWCGPAQVHEGSCIYTIVSTCSVLKHTPPLIPVKRNSTLPLDVLVELNGRLVLKAAANGQWGELYIGKEKYIYQTSYIE